MINVVFPYTVVINLTRIKIDGSQLVSTSGSSVTVRDKNMGNLGCDPRLQCGDYGDEVTAL